MKTKIELADYFGPNPAPLKNRASSLKRTTTVLQHEIERFDSTGLSPTDKEKLAAAVGVLIDLGSRFGGAAKILSEREKLFERTNKQVLVAMKANFAVLSSVRDMVLLIAAVNSYVLRTGQIQSHSDLSYFFRDSLNSLSYTMTRKAISEKQAAGQVVMDHWSRWQAEIPTLEQKYKSLITTLDKTS